MLFLNHQRFPRLHQHAILKRGVCIRVPQPKTTREVGDELAATRPVYHTLDEEATVRRVAEATGVAAQQLLALNQRAIRGLTLASILKRGTRLLLRGPEADFEEYQHWSFPDDDPEAGCPSYMMARRLKPTHERRDVRESTDDPSSIIERTKALLVPERPPLIPSPSRLAIFDRARRASERAAAAREAAANGQPSPMALDGAPPAPRLFNRVVRIEGETERYEYYYVLTYLPDLQWCHVAPLTKRGLFKGTGSASDGRPRWMLVSEEEGGEIDVGAGRCPARRSAPLPTPHQSPQQTACAACAACASHRSPRTLTTLAASPPLPDASCTIMEAREMKGTEINADDEEWDIIGPAAQPS